jgi:hypothetical protein
MLPKSRTKPSRLLISVPTAPTILSAAWPGPEVLAQLAVIAAISTRERFSKAVLDGIARANYVHKIGQGLRNTKKIKRELNAVAKKGRAYSEALNKCSKDTALLIALRPNPYGLIIPPDLPKMANHAAGVAAAASRATTLKALPQNFALRLLVEEVLDAAAAEGVKLTVSDASDDLSTAGGSLARVLAALRNYRWQGERLVGEGLIPNPIPYKPLQRMSSAWTKNRAKLAK